MLLRHGMAGLGKYSAPSASILSYGDLSIPTITTDTITASAMPIGTAASDRDVYACVVTNASATSAVTIGGVSATKITESNTLQYNRVSIWKARVTTGTTADVVATSAAVTSGLVRTYYGNNLTEGDTSTSFGNNTTPWTLGVDTLSGDTILGAWGVRHVSALTSATSSDIAIDGDPTTRGSMALYLVTGRTENAGAATPTSITVTPNTTFQWNACGVAIRPA